MRRTPKKDPPEPMPDPVETCDDCGRDQRLEVAPTDTTSHADGAVTEQFYCEGCASVVHERLCREPDGV